MKPLPPERLVELAREARERLAMFSDQATATLEIRGTELVAVLVELLAWRASSSATRAAATSAPDHYSWCTCGHCPRSER